MLRTFFIAARVIGLTLVVTGVVYPLLVTAMAQGLFFERANGSVVRNETGGIVGSELIAQPFVRDGYFQPRPSTAGHDGYDASASGGLNLGPTSARLKTRVAKDVERLLRENPEAKPPIPLDLVTASASGLDPHLSPEATFWQVERVARSRGVAPERVRAVVLANLEGRELGLFGEPRVNVLVLNLGLD